MHVKWLLIQAAAAVATLQAACLASAGEVKMSSLAIGSVELRLVARTYEMGEKEISAFFAEARKVILMLSAYYSTEPAAVGLWAPAKDAAAVIKLVEGVARDPYEKWQITIQVNREGWGKSLLSEAMLKEQQRIARERPKRLKWPVLLDEDATIGDALKTLADTLSIGVAVMPSLVHAHGNDWKAVLELPLASTKDETDNGLTVQDLADRVAERLGGVSWFEEFFLLFDDAEEAAKRQALMRKGEKPDDPEAVKPDAQEKDGEEEDPSAAGQGRPE